ncbi:MAG: sulfite exporter TauE/SafE family protein [Candidatus Moraniibacteriota bacterium]
MEKIIVPIAGMHCRSCELLVEGNLAEIPEVKKSEVNYKKGIAEVYYSGQKPKMSEIENAVRESGYTLGTKGKTSWVSHQMSDWQDLGIALLVLLFAYLVIKNLGIAGWNPVGNSGNPSSLGVVFLVGITAGLSTCLALVGGLVLGVAARHAESHPEATVLQKFRPHIFFNLGRVIGYTVLGGLLGWLGSFLQLSNGFLGGMTIAVSLVMLLLGIKLLGVFPRMESAGWMLPKSISRFFGSSRHQREYSHRGSFAMGALTFFLPCGFTQTMQLYAVSTGSFTQGALILGVFALGTAPGLLGVGGLSSIVRGVFARRFFVFAGMTVAVLALFNLSNGWTLLKNDISFAPPVAPVATGGILSESGVAPIQPSPAQPIGDFQTMIMTESSRGYAPNAFTVHKGIPVQWIIDAREPYSCASTVIAPAFGIQKNLKQGENVIEFTPKQTGVFPFSCSMGMYSGTITVIE